MTVTDVVRGFADCAAHGTAVLGDHRPMRFMIAGGAEFVKSSRSSPDPRRPRRRLRGRSLHGCDPTSPISWTTTATSSSKPTSRTTPIGVDVIAHLASPASPVDYDRMPLHTSGQLARDVSPPRRGQPGRRGAVFTSTSEDLRRPARPSPTGDVLGQCRPGGPALLLRRSEAIQRGAPLRARRETGVQANVVRLFNTYGPGMRHDDGRVIPEMVSAALAGRPLVIHGDGSQTRELLLRVGPRGRLSMVIHDDGLDGGDLQHRQPPRDHRPRAGHAHHRPDRERQRAAVHERSTRRPRAAAARHRTDLDTLRLGAARHPSGRARGDDRVLPRPDAASRRGGAPARPHGLLRPASHTSTHVEETVGVR